MAEEGTLAWALRRSRELLTGVADKDRSRVKEELYRRGAPTRQVLSQIPQGLISTTVANSSRASRGQKESGASIAGYRPAIVDAPGALIGALGTLGSLVGLPTAPAKGGYLANSMDRAGAANQNTNEALGIKDPENAAQMGLNVLGSIIVGGPKAKAATTLAGKVARGTAEAVLPLRQTGLKSAAAITVPLGVGMREGIDKIANTDDYHSVGEDSTPKPATIEQPAPGEPLVIPEQLLTPQQPAPGEMLVLPEADQEEAKETNWAVAGTVLAAAGLAVVGAKYARNAAVTAPFTSLTPSSIGHKIQRSTLGAANKLLTNVVDSNLPIRSAANEALTPNAARRVNFRLDSIGSTATGAQVTHFFKTGEAPFASRPYKSPAVVAERFATELTPQEQKTVGDALLYATSLDDFNRTGVNASFSSIATTDKRQLVDFVRLHPKMGPHFLEAQNSYKELIQYRVDTGTMTSAEAAAMRAAGPNYVHMSQDVSDDFSDSGLMSNRFDAQRSSEKQIARNIDEERAGVQGNARNPVHELPGQWAQAIRFGKVNDFRMQTLDELAASGARNVDGAPLVRRLPTGQTPKSTEKVHTVYENGTTIHYQVNDPALDATFRMQSRAAFKPLEAWRQLRQSFTTGTIGSLSTGFQFAISPFYETQLGAILRPKGMHQGLVNEMLGKVGKSIGPLDPTVPLTSYTGAVRYMFDEMTNRLASHLTNSLMSANTPLQKMMSGNVSEMVSAAIGDANTTALRDALDQAYQTGIKATGDRIGAFSNTMRGSDDSLELSAGLNDIAPNFVVQEGVDRYKAYMSNKEYGKGILAGMRVPWLQARTSSFGELLDLAQESMRNGFAYSNIAANRTRVTNMDELASMIRRNSVDTSQHGASPTVNVVTGSIEYSNLGLQTLYEIGKRAKESPLTFGTNFMLSLGSLVALKYASMSDPEVVSRNNEKTPEQRARTISLPMGMEMPVEQSLRPFWATASTLFDHISGAASGEFNPDFLNAISNWFDSEGDRASSEDLQDDLSRSLHAAIKANNPLAPENSGTAQALAAMQGLDPSMTALTGTPTEVQTQQISGFDQDKTFVGSMTSAFNENMITTILGSFAEHALRTADEVYRAHGHTDGPVDSMQIIADHWKDRMAGGTKAFRPMIFGQYEGVKSVADVNYDLVKRRDKGIQQAMDLFHKDVMAGALQGSAIDPRYYDNEDDPIYQLDPKYIGTPLQFIGQRTQMLQRQTATIDKELGALNNQKQRTQGDTSLRVEDRNKKLNDINDQRKALYYQKLYGIRMTEDLIAQDLGVEHFSYDGFDPKKVMEQAPTE